MDLSDFRLVRADSVAKSLTLVAIPAKRLQVTGEVIGNYPAVHTRKGVASTDLASLPRSILVNMINGQEGKLLLSATSASFSVVSEYILLPLKVFALNTIAVAGVIGYIAIANCGIGLTKKAYCFLKYLTFLAKNISKLRATSTKGASLLFLGLISFFLLSTAFITGSLGARVQVSTNRTTNTLIAISIVVLGCEFIYHLLAHKMSILRIAYEVKVVNGIYGYANHNVTNAVGGCKGEH